MSLEELRRQYTICGLSESNLPSNPLGLFSTWLEVAMEHAPADWIEPYAMTLATSTPTGQVSARMVLLRGFDEKGFVFYTNYDSRKGAELAANNNSALVFYWGYLERQVRVTGTATKVERALSAEYFRQRPRGSQIGASVSRQSTVIQSRDELELAVSGFKAELGEGTVPLPEFWGGYRVFPYEIEFWQGRENRLHDRLVYARKDEGHSWELKRLSP